MNIAAKKHVSIKAQECLYAGVARTFPTLICLFAKTFTKVGGFGIFFTKSFLKNAAARARVTDTNDVIWMRVGD
jgi:hypothetical protein